jgi:hypothetical protein
MTQANPGNLLKFNTQPFWQRHKQPGQDRHPFGLKCPATRLMPFQLFIDAGAGVVTWKVVNPSDATGATFTAMTAGDLTITNKDSGGFWVTWGGDVDLTTEPDCGFWEVWVTVDGTIYYSEVLHTYDDQEPTPIWRFRLQNDTDKGNVLYNTLGAGASFAYTQFFYPQRWAWDRPEIDRDLEITVDGNGLETTRFTRTVAKFRIEVSDVPDYAIPFFAKCGDLDLVSFEDVAGVNFVTMTNVVFESKIQGVGLNIGVFKFDAEVEAFNGCQENFVLA